MRAGLFAYAWDLADEGYDRALDAIAEAGFDEVNLATAYHAGKFLLPRNPTRRVYFPEDGAVFFRPEPSRYGRLEPRVHSLVTDATSPVETLIANASGYGLAYTAWTVCLHNSWLGAQFPDVTMHTAFGDPLIHSLSPAHPDVREYLLALIDDLVSRHDVPVIQLESPGYMGFTHGYHHEIIGVELGPVSEHLLSMSFNAVELERASAAGIPAAEVRQRVADALDRAWNAGETLGDADPGILNDPDVAAYRTWMDVQALSLAEAIRDLVRDRSPRTQIRHFVALDGSDADERLIAASDGLLCGYARGEAIGEKVVAAKAHMGKTVSGAIRAIAPDTTDPAVLGERFRAWKDAGVDSVDVYNYGLMPGITWRAVARALREL